MLNIFECLTNKEEQNQTDKEGRMTERKRVKERGGGMEGGKKEG